MVVGHISMDHTFFNVHQSQRHDSTHPRLFIYHRFLKCHLKCENFLECELVMLPEIRHCTKVIAWSGDFGMDQYVFWRLSNEELTLDTIWKKFEEFCKPRSNEMKARFNLLTSFQQGNKTVDEWYNAVQT